METGLTGLNGPSVLNLVVVAHRKGLALVQTQRPLKMELLVKVKIQKHRDVILKNVQVNTIHHNLQK